MTTAPIPSWGRLDAGEVTGMLCSGRLQLGIAYLILLVAAALPLTLTTYLPLDDYHNHLARMHILVQDGADPVLNQFYRTNWQVVPNLAMDLLVPWLAQLMPLEDAARLFTGLIFVLITTGTVALYAALHRELSWWPLLAFLFLYNRVLLFGHLNYLAGVGLFLWALAAWIYLRERSPLLRLAVFSVLSTGLFFAHLYALGFYAIAVAGYELAEAVRRPGGMRELMRQSPAALGQFLIPAYLFLFQSPTAGDAETFSYFGLWWHFWNKVRATHQILLSYHVWFDRLTFVVLAGALVMALALRWVEIDRRMRLPLILLLLVFLALPQALLGALLVDFRLPAGVVFVLIASIRPRPGGVPFARAVAAALAALFLVRMGLVTERWHAFDQVYDRYLEAIAGLPPGSRFVTASAQRPDPHEALAPTLMYVNALAVIEKSAFEPMVFANPRQQPIVVTEDYRLLASSYPWEWPAAPLEKLAPGLADGGGDSDRPEGLLFEYDFLLLLYPRDASNPAPALLEQLAVTPRFHLYRIRRSAAAGRHPATAG